MNLGFFEAFYSIDENVIPALGRIAASKQYEQKTLTSSTKS